MNQGIPKLAGCLMWGVTGLALLLSFLALIGRPDSMEDLARGKVCDIVILGPAWGATIFMHAYARLKGMTNGKAIAVGLAVVTWILSSWIATSWEQKKVDMRMEGWHRMEEQMKKQKDPEPTNAPYSGPASRSPQR